MVGFSPLVTPVSRTDSTETPVEEKKEVAVTSELVGFGETTTVIGTLSETEAHRLLGRCHEVEERLGHASSFEEREVVLTSFLVEVEKAGLLPEEYTGEDVFKGIAGSLRWRMPMVLPVVEELASTVIHNPLSLIFGYGEGKSESLCLLRTYAVVYFISHFGLWWLIYLLALPHVFARIRPKFIVGYGSWSVEHDSYIASMGLKGMHHISHGPEDPGSSFCCHVEFIGFVGIILHLPPLGAVICGSTFYSVLINYCM